MKQILGKILHKLRKKFYVPKDKLEIDSKMPTMMIYKSLKCSKDTLEELILVDWKEDLVHMFKEVGLKNLKTLEINVYNEVQPTNKKHKEEVSDIPRIPLNYCQWLIELKLINCPTLTNRIFEIIVDNLLHLQRLEIGGRAEEYNSNITLDGIKILWGSESENKNKDDDEEDDFRMHKGLKSSLVTIKIEYCVKIGNQAIEMICNRFYETLENFSIIRNYYEFSAKITDEALEHFNKWKNLK